jgi:hypothetical protein
MGGWVGFIVGYGGGVKGGVWPVLGGGTMGVGGSAFFRRKEGRTERYPFFQPERKKILKFWVSCGHFGLRGFRNCSKQPFLYWGSLMVCFFADLS